MIHFLAPEIREGPNCKKLTLPRGRVPAPRQREKKMLLVFLGKPPKTFPPKPRKRGANRERGGEKSEGHITMIDPRGTGEEGVA